MPRGSGLEWKQLLAAGAQLTALSRTQARRLAGDFVTQGELARDQISAAVDEMLDISRRRTEELSKLIRTEVRRQLGVLGIATKEDLARLERKVASATRATSKKAPANKKVTKKTAGRSRRPVTKKTTRASR